MTPNPTAGKPPDIKIESSIIQRAAQDDPAAIMLMFKQFIPEEETIYFAQYLGLQGLWGFGNREFACLTDRRVADITVGRFGEVTYQDGCLEHINSCSIYQPSKKDLYFLIAFCVLLSIVTLIVSVILLSGIWKFLFIFLSGLLPLSLPIVVQLYYRFKKSGVVITVRGGIPIYMFTNRKLLTRANALYRLLSISREARIKLRGVG